MLDITLGPEIMQLEGNNFKTTKAGQVKEREQFDNKMSTHYME